MITPINNQPIRLQNEETIDVSCDCLGQGFCQLINKNDATKFQVLASTNLVTNGDFETDLSGWTTNGSWAWLDGVAEYQNESGLGALEQQDVFEVGKFYAMTFTISTSDEDNGGGFTIDSFGATEYETYGTFTVIGQALQVDLVITPFDSVETGESSVTVDNIVIYEIPAYTIKDADGLIVFAMEDNTGVTASGDIVQYEIDWSDFDEGCYTINMSSGGIDYISDCLTVKLDHDCSILLTWTNDENAFGFDYSDLSFTQSLRVKAKKWHPNYTKEKNVFKDNSGNRTILKSETSKEELLTISEMPIYLHDALAIGLEHDDFYIDSVKYTNEETEYTPKWRKSSQLAPSEVVVIKDQLLKNNSC